jgi:energy-coupling factor transporter ATP-binding protein EcfA2
MVGMSQLVMIAAFLVLLEPATGLGPRRRDSVWQIIRDLVRTRSLTQIVRRRQGG